MTNPYAGFLAGRDAKEVIAASPARLAELAKTLGAAGLERRSAPGKWTAREILCHLADTEIAFAFRLRQALAEAHHVIQPFDQEKWAGNYASLTASDAVAAYSALRAWNLLLIRTVPDSALSKPLTHPERGAMTFQTLLETMAGHDLNHMHQLEGIAASA